MTAVELALEIGNGAREDLLKVTSRKEGWLASARDQNFGVFFTRDAAISSIITLDLIRNRPDHPDREKLLENIRNSLLAMARYQGKTFNPWRDEEPGKFIHEERHERNPKNQARLAELKREGWPVVGNPGRYRMRDYASIDATPLGIIDFCDYIEFTGDRRFFKKLDPNLRSGLVWIERYGDVDGDFYIEYEAKNRNTLINQGWKDSGDSIKDEHGLHPKEPIALVEVQGYQYEALVKASNLYAEDDPEYSARLKDRARELKFRFNREFWMEDKGFFAYALDGDKKQIKDVVSNVGHLLITGIVEEEKLPLVVNRLMQPDMLTDGGIRTLSSNSNYFSDQDPEGYHNGSIWPHDNMIIIMGLRQRGFLDEAGTIEDRILNAEGILKHEYDKQNIELYMVDRSGKIVPYGSAQKPQGWDVATNLRMTAAAA